jgi:hypothetical protein
MLTVPKPSIGSDYEVSLAANNDQLSPIFKEPHSIDDLLVSITHFLDDEDKYDNLLTSSDDDNPTSTNSVNGFESKTGSFQKQCHVSIT